MSVEEEQEARYQRPHAKVSESTAILISYFRTGTLNFRSEERRFFCKLAQFL
jgi:hypothetical protein